MPTKAYSNYPGQKPLELVAQDPPSDYVDHPKVLSMVVVQKRVNTVDSKKKLPTVPHLRIDKGSPGSALHFGTSIHNY